MLSIVCPAGPIQLICVSYGESTSLVAVQVRVISWPSTPSTLVEDNSIVGGPKN